MKNILLKIILFLLIFLIPTIAFADSKVDPKLEKNYNKLISILEKKYTIDKELNFLKKLSKKLYYIIENKKLKEDKLSLANDLIKLTNEKIFSIKFNKKLTLSNNKFDIFPISKNFKNILYLEIPFFLENWIWYTYLFDSYVSFPKWAKITPSDLDFNEIDINNNLIFIDLNENLWFIKRYKKIKLINDDIIYWIANKYNFLSNIQDDKLFLHEDTDLLFKKLKFESITNTKKLKRDEKIKVLYDYILNKVEYTKDIDLNDKKIFSWIHTYKNNDWTCWGYSKLFSYMLSFAWIDNNEFIKWFVIDADDFPKIWHAWVKIWDKYFDPTFDDPIWIIKTKTYDEYKFFNLPRDLFYTNRYDYLDIPEEIKNSSLEYRKKLIMKNISWLIDKYKDDNYRLTKPFDFRKKYDLGPYEDFTISKLKKIFPYTEVKNHKFIENWKAKQIKSLTYFTINDWDEEIESFLDQFNYDIEWFYLFKWHNEDWTIEYRLVNNLIFH